MFLGSALNPRYFDKKVNLFVALGPVTSLNNCMVEALRISSAEWPEVEYIAVKEGAYNLMDAGWLEEDAAQAFCAELEGLCEGLLKNIADADPSVDAMDRFNVFLKDFPAGEGYGALVYYAQSIQNTDGYRRRNFGAVKNMDKYGTIKPPFVPLDQISIPTALFVGQYDNLATVADNEWLVTQLNPEALVWHRTYPLGHLSFSLAKDMSYFKEDVMSLVNQYATNVYSEEETIATI